MDIKTDAAELERHQDPSNPYDMVLPWFSGSAAMDVQWEMVAAKRNEGLAVPWTSPIMFDISEEKDGSHIIDLNSYIGVGADICFNLKLPPRYGRDGHNPNLPWWSFAQHESGNIGEIVASSG
jgi:hypothetical protein